MAKKKEIKAEPKDCSKFNESVIKVIQKDMEGNFIAEFNSYQDAARAVYKNIRKQISKCCNSELDSIGGFKWEKK